MAAHLQLSLIINPLNIFTGEAILNRLFALKNGFPNEKDNPADYMARHQSTRISKTQENYTEQHINCIVKHLLPKALTRKEIIDETITDVSSNRLKDAILSNNWENRNLDAIRRYAKEFTITTDGLNKTNCS